MVTETSSWARMTGNVRIDVLSESPWSAMEIAQSLVAAGDTDVNTLRMENNKMRNAPPTLPTSPTSPTPSTPSTPPTPSTTPPTTNQAGDVPEMGRSNNNETNDETSQTSETKSTSEEEPPPPTAIATASGQYRPQFQMPDGV